LISYGVGSTAKALTDTRQLQSIDVVDISRSILDLSAIVFPDPREHPLHDERVRVHIEDGRFFLQTTDRRFDLITSEPPPPKIAGVVNLYTREYFELIRARLAEGGMATYWLPVFQLSENDTLSVIKGFCDAFADCSLWAGSGLDWMLIGTRNATGPVSEEHFRRQWQDAVVGPKLRALGLEEPEQLGALFMADATELKRLTQDALPLTDNFPGRLSRYEISSSPAEPLYAAMMDAGRAREAFAQSTFIAGLWPPKLRTASLEFFDYQRMITLRFAPKYRLEDEYIWDELHRTLTQTSLRTLPLWLVRSSQREQDIVAEVGDESVLDREMELTRAHGAIARRDYERAIEHFHAYMELQPPNRMFHEHRLYRYVLAAAGRLEEAVRFGEKMFRAAPANPAERRYRRWMQRTFGLANPVAQSAHGHLAAGAAPARPATGRSELP
jgi:tetratricopeptide (TPR) repeat protein